MTKKIISVTGASGFLGQSFIRCLLKDNFSVVVLDHHGSKYPKDVKVIKGDLLTGDGVEEFIKDSEVLVHLAGQILSGGTSMTEGNFQTTKNLIASLKYSKIRNVIFSSSIAVYGSSKTKIFKESDRCLPDTPYGRSKLKAEQVIKQWAKETNNPYTIFRFFSLYGENNKKGLIYNLCTDFVAKGQVTIYGEGIQERDLVNVEDAARVLMLPIQEKLNGVYNVGTGKSLSILSIVRILEKISGRNCKINFKKREKGKVETLSYSISKLQRKTNWKPKITLSSFISKALSQDSN